MIQLNCDISMPNGHPRDAGRAQAMLDEISHSKPDNVLFFTHQMLPHAPWRFLPSGTEYDRRPSGRLVSGRALGGRAWLVLQGYQRYLLQVGYVDAAGRAGAAHARSSGSLRPIDDRRRRRPRCELPCGRGPPAGDRAQPRRHHQRSLVREVSGPDAPGIDSRLVRSVDILPTIADVLGIRLPWQVDGVSLLGRLPDREIVVGLREDSRVQASLAEMISNRESTLRHKNEEFGEGRDSLFRIGTNKALLGRDVEASLNARRLSRWRSRTGKRWTSDGRPASSRRASRAMCVGPARRGCGAGDRSQRTRARPHHLVLGRRGNVQRFRSSSRRTPSVRASTRSTSSWCADAARCLARLDWLERRKN